MDTLFNILVALAVFLFYGLIIAGISYLLFGLFGWLKEQYNKSDISDEVKKNE